MSASNFAELERCLHAIGVNCYIPESTDWPVFEGDYMKFMGGPAFDERACDGFEAWLKRAGYSYERHRERAIRNLDPRAVERINVLWRLRPEEDPTGEDTFPLPLDWDLYRDEDGDWCLTAPKQFLLMSEPGEPLLLQAETLAEAIDEALVVARGFAHTA